ncbi:MAG: hypothetical protein GY811_11280 [Myxococcales bacterium]|nr:hypothetical protein [Myxococcales bacterium]
MRYVNKTLFALSLALGGVAAVSLALPTSALADRKSAKRIKTKTEQGMGEYDMMEFEAAKSLLMEAINIGEGNDTRGPELASAYLNLGIVYFSGLGEEDKASEAFENALGVDAEVKLSVAYSTPEMSELLEAARGKVGTSGGDCSIDGLAHELVDEAASGSAPEMRARLGSDIDAASVLVYYRGEGQLEFSRASMKKTGSCEYVGNIPTRAVQGEFVHYYIAAVDSDGKELEHKGTSGSPNIIEVSAASGGSVSSDSDDSLGGEKDDGSLLSEKSGPSVFLSVAAGTGGGYVQGPTEKSDSQVDCCIAPALLHLMPEIGYFISDQLSVSGAFRMGFPIGANVMGHASFAPAGLLRVRYALSPSGEGIQVSGALGAGVIRNTVQIKDPTDAAMDTDTTAMGPVLFGGGFGYAKSLGGPMKIVAEVNAIAAVTAGFDELGPCGEGEDGCVRPKSGAQVDANLALLFAF